MYSAYSGEDNFTVFHHHDGTYMTSSSSSYTNNHPCHHTYGNGQDLPTPLPSPEELLLDSEESQSSSPIFDVDNDNDVDLDTQSSQTGFQFLSTSPVKQFTKSFNQVDYNYGMPQNTPVNPLGSYRSNSSSSGISVDGTVTPTTPFIYKPSCVIINNPIITSPAYYNANASIFNSIISDFSNQNLFSIVNPNDSDDFDAVIGGPAEETDAASAVLFTNPEIYHHLKNEGCGDDIGKPTLHYQNDCVSDDKPKIKISLRGLTNSQPSTKFKFVKPAKSKQHTRKPPKDSVAEENSLMVGFNPNIKARFKWINISIDQIDVNAFLTCKKDNGVAIFKTEADKEQAVQFWNLFKQKNLSLKLKIIGLLLSNESTQRYYNNNDEDKLFDHLPMMNLKENEKVGDFDLLVHTSSGYHDEVEPFENELYNLRHLLILKDLKKYQTLESLKNLNKSIFKIPRESNVWFLYKTHMARAVAILTVASFVNSNDLSLLSFTLESLEADPKFKNEVTAQINPKTFNPKFNHQFTQSAISCLWKLKSDSLKNECLEFERLEKQNHKLVYPNYFYAPNAKRAVYTAPRR